MGLVPVTADAAPAGKKFPYVLFAAPPSGSADYPAAVQSAAAAAAADTRYSHNNPPNDIYTAVYTDALNSPQTAVRSTVTRAELFQPKAAAQSWPPAQPSLTNGPADNDRQHWLQLFA
jgi:hypothetical protein